MTFFIKQTRQHDNGTPMRFDIFYKNEQDTHVTSAAFSLESSEVPVAYLDLKENIPFSGTEVAANIASILNGNEPIEIQSKTPVFYDQEGANVARLRCALENQGNVTRKVATLTVNSGAEINIDLSASFFAKLCGAHQIMNKSDLTKSNKLKP